MLVASLFINVLALTPPLFFILVFNRYVASGFDGTLITLSTGMVIALLFKTVFGLARNRIAEEMTGEGASVRLHQTFLQLIRARVAGLQRLSGPRVLEAVHGPTAQREVFAPHNICAVFDAPFAMFSIVLIFFLNIQLGMLTLAGLVLTVVLTVHGQYALRGPSRELGETVATGRHLAAQAYSEQDTIRTFGAQSFLLRLWDTHLQRLQALRSRLFRVEGLNQNLTETSSLLLRAAIIALGAWLVVHGQLSVGTVIGISFLAGVPMALAGRFIRALSAMAVAREQTRKTSLLRELPLEPDQGLAKKSLAGGISFEDLAFAWPQAGGPLFESLTLHLPAGRFLAVSGRNGTGKTTLARMIVGLLEPTRGQIMIDDLNMRQIAPEWWRRQLVYLPQEPSFLNISLRENIRLANPELSEETLHSLLALSGLQPFLAKHPQGVEQTITEGGRLLSPGIRRRLALARALAVNGPLVLLDDPTEGLDTEGCRTILDRLKKFSSEKRTIIVMSNDMRLLNLADHFLDLNRKPVPTITRAGQQDGQLP